MHAALGAAMRLPHRTDFRGWIEVPGRGEYRLSLGALKLLAEAHGLRPRGKHITPAIERRSSAFHRAFLRGLFDADGSVQGTQAKGVSVRLSQSNRDDLLAVQRMLLRLGIASTIYSDRRDAGPRELPDGQGGAKLYSIRAQHELVVANDNLSVYAERVGFADHEKAARLSVAISGYRRRPNREAFVATIEAVEEAGEAEVFDAAIPGINAFDANGFWSHNCGEQPLPPYGACLLGSINLARFVEQPFTPEARLDAGRLAAIVPDAVRHDGQRHRHLRLSAADAAARRRAASGASGSASPGWPTR